MRFVGNPVNMAGKYIISAELYLTEQASSHTTGTVEIKKPKTSWNSSSITWNNQPELEEEALASFTCTGVSETVHHVDLTEWAQDLANRMHDDSTIEDTGLVFVAKEEGTGEKINGPSFKYSYNSDGIINKALYMTLTITYSDIDYVNAESIELVECDYATKTETTYEYVYDKTITNATEAGYIPVDLLTEMNSVQPFAIFPGDTLDYADENLYPYSTIVRFAYEEDEDGNAVIDDYNGYGSGYIIGPNVILTAAHCVREGTVGWKENMVIFTNLNDTSYSGLYRINKIICPTEYCTSAQGEYDWAIVIVDGNIGERNGWMGFGVSQNLQDKAVTVAGYAEIGDEKWGRLYKKDGQIDSYTMYNVSYHISTIGGQSGGPVFDENNISWAIHTYGQGGVFNNGGRRIDACVYNLLKDKKEEGKLKYNYE